MNKLDDFSSIVRKAANESTMMTIMVMIARERTKENAGAGLLPGTRCVAGFFMMKRDVF